MTQPDQPQLNATVFVQWKGTDVCLDFRCACGYRAHFDGDFAYQLRCTECGRVYEMPHIFTPVEVGPDAETTIQEPYGPGHPPRDGPAVVDMRDEP